VEETVIMFSSKFVIGLLIFIIFVHIIATVNYWYWTIWWFDIPMHFLGGFWVAIVFIWLNSKFDILKFNPINGIVRTITTFITVLSFAAFIGVLWEFAEFLFDVFISSGGYEKIIQ